MVDNPDLQDERAAIRAAAHDWRARLDDESVSQEDRAAFEAWLAEDIRHGEEYTRIAELWASLDAISEETLSPENQASLDRARHVSSSDIIDNHPIGESAPWISSPWFARAIGAVATGGLAATLALFVVPLPNLLKPNSEQIEPIVVTYATERAEIKEIVLADGSSATLGADTALSFSTSPTQRRVALTRGEAFFDVISDSGRPFTVSAGDLIVNVTGTAFDVKLGETQASVAVSEGDVRVSYPMMIGGEAQPSMRTRRRLSAGFSITATQDRGLRPPEPISTDGVGAWRQGRLVYVAAPLGEVVADANRYTAKQIAVSDSSIAGLTVSGSFDAAKTEETLDILAEILPIRIDRSRVEQVTIRAASE